MEEKNTKKHFSEFLNKTTSLLDRIEYLCKAGFMDDAQKSIDLIDTILRPARKELDAIADKAGVVD
jgi:hypothetical protein